MAKTYTPGGPAAAGGGQGFLSVPSTKLGRWSVVLAAIFVVFFIIDVTVLVPSSDDAPWRRTVLPFYGLAMLSCGLAAGIVGLIAAIRRRERSWLVWLAMLPGLMVVALILGEFLAPH